MVLRGHHCGLPASQDLPEWHTRDATPTPARTVTRALPAVVASGLIGQPVS